MNIDADQEPADHVAEVAEPAADSAAEATESANEDVSQETDGIKEAPPAVVEEVGMEARAEPEEAKEELTNDPFLETATQEWNSTTSFPVSSAKEDDGAPAVEIKFVVLPEGFVHYSSTAPETVGNVLYNHLSQVLRIDRRSLRISWHGTQLADDDILSAVVDIRTGPVTMNVEMDYVPRHVQLLQKYENCPYALEVRINYGEGIPPKSILVAVVKGYHHKQFVGGYRNKKSGVEYHHGVAQTDALKKEPKAKTACLTRDTQTAGISRSQQSKREAWTQMARPGLEVDTSEDVVYTARTYFSAQQLHELRVLKSIVLQAHFRGWFARRLATRMRREEEVAQEERQKVEDQRRTEHEEKRQKEIDRRTHPRTPADFAILYNELEAWRLQETNKINESSLAVDDKQLARQELLKKETRLLQTIDKLQIKANQENKKAKTTSTLGAMAAHKTWNHSKNELGHTVVETPFTVRAKELLDLYNGLQLKGLSVDERLDILLHVKWTVKEFECALTREVVELVDREADLLNRGRKEKSLDGLRSRMSNLFLQFCETPEFNPEAINHQRVALEFTTRPLVKLDATKR